MVVTVSPTLSDALRRLDVDPVLIPNGCDITHFSSTAPPTGKAQEQPVVAYVGHLSDRVDVGLLEAVASSGVQLRLVGPRQETMTNGHFDGLLEHPNVTWVGSVPYAELPQVLSDVTTCVLPYSDTDFNRASFPLKTLEYLAAGRRVVATGLPAITWLDTDLVSVANTPSEFAAAVTASLTQPLGQGEIRGRRAFAAEHSWEARGRILARTLNLVPVSDVGWPPHVEGVHGL